MTDIPANSSTTETLALGGTVVGTVDTPGDRDWYRVSLTPNQWYTFTLSGTGASALQDPYLKLYNAAGTLVAENDDSGVGHGAKIVFQAPNSGGTFYIDAGAWDLTSIDPPEQNTDTGDYSLSMQLYTAPTEWTTDQIANQLVNGYWEETERSARHFNVTQGGTITYNIEALNTAGRNLAIAALAEWSDVIGVTFTRVTTNDAQITFDDNSNATEAYSTSTVSGGFITHSDVQISTSWLTQSGTAINSYSFQTYIHEIGHALGLGHAGNYNNTADFKTDALYSNDGWPMTVMSYFSPDDNLYFHGYSTDYTVSPMAADIVAMQQMYGLSTITRVGDTVYGFNSTAGRDIYNAQLNPSVRYAIFDSGGTDTIDGSGAAIGQGLLINLNQETFSNFLGIKNLYIPRTVVIENAIGGPGDDTFIANSANNVLDGRGGYNTISYASATAGVTINMLLTGPQNTGGSGTDTLLNYGYLIASDYDDVLTSRGGNTTWIQAGAGNDRIIVGGGGEQLWGEGGDDYFVVSSAVGGSFLIGGSGTNTADFSGMSVGVSVDLSLGRQSDLAGTFASANSLSGIHRVIGTSSSDWIQADSNSFIVAGAGNDTLVSGFGGQIYGGVGDDTYIVYFVSSELIELAGEGTDSVQTQVSYTLGANFENLSMLYNGAINGTGNSLDNMMTGNSGANTLLGLDGNDVLDGREGADALDGGAGNDRIVYDAVDNPANVTGGSGTDTLVVINQAAPTAYNLVAGGFEGSEVTMRDFSGSYSWLSVVTNYNSSWQALNQNMANDDGSLSYTVFDWNNAQAWDEIWFTYNAAGQQISEDYRYDDGKRSWVAIDAAGAETWSQVWFTYNSAGQQISEDYRYDDGKRSWVSIDAANASNWAQVWFTYDVSGNKVSEDYRYDDNSRSWVAFDADSSKVWDHIWFTYDANGHQTSEDRTNDNGTRVWTAYDANSNLAWSTDAFYYDNTGHLYQSIRTWDDGHTTTTLF